MRNLFQDIHKNKIILIFFIIGSIAFIQAFNSIILGRILSKESFGLYSFLFSTIVPLVSSVVILGQNISVIRYFSKYNFLNFRWKSYFRNVSVISFLLISIIVLFICVSYKLSFYYSTYIFIAIFSLVMLTFAAAFLRSRKKFVLATLLESPSAPIFIILIGLSFLLNINDIKPFATLKTVSYLLPFLIAFFLFLKKERNGSREIENTIYFDGLLLWGIGLTLLAISKFDGFFIVKYIDYESIAEYSILFTFTQIYQFACGAIWSVYSQKFSSHYKPNLISFLSKICLIAISISLFYLLVGKPLLHILFNGKYDSSIYLLLPFCVIGCLRLAYLYPSCYLIGKSSSNTLKSFLALNIVGLILKLFFLITFIKYYGLLGAVLSGIIVLIYRNVVGYCLVTNDIRKKRDLR